jgi:cbb3-type cytochrome oxidase maturation protein
MEVIYGLIPGMLVLGLVAVAVLFWAARSGQFDDLEGDANRILMDEDATDPRRFPDADEQPERPGPGGAGQSGSRKKV